MKQKMKKISLMACSLIMAATVTSGLYAVSNVQEVSAEGVVASYVSTDTETKSAWETAGYGTDGYIILGANSSNEKTVYSNLYAEQGNDGKTEITVYHDNQKAVYYDKNGTTMDSTAPISKLVVNDGSSVTWKNTADKVSHWGPNQPDLYKPGTETTYPVRTYNGNTDPYHDRGIGFTLRETKKTYVTAYVLDWSKKVSETNPITVGLFSGIQITTFYGYTNTAKTLEDHYGTPLVKTTVTSQGAYATFAIEGSGNYQIVCYYDNEGTSNAPVTPMMTGLFFDVEVEEEPETSDTPYVPADPVAPTEKVFVDSTSKSNWEANGYGTDGYLVMGANASNKAAAYSNMYTEQGNDGKTEIAMVKQSDNSWCYESNGKTFDSDAPISKLVLNGSSIWQNGNQSKTSYLYIPGTGTTYPGRIHNNMDSVYRDFGLGFTLRETEKTYVTAYIADWEGRASEDLPITVALYSGIKTGTIQAYSGSPIVRDKTIEDHYGTALAETTITTYAGAYVTFEIEGKGDYQIVAYYDNQDPKNTTSKVAPMFLGLFFEKELYPEVTSTSLSLEGDIGVNYYVGAHGQDLTGAIMQVEYANDTFEKISASSKNADGTYKFQVKVSAKDYSAKMKICLFTEDGTTLSRVFEYCPADYVASVLNAGEAVYGEKLVALATALDDYGKAAANLFYNEENTFKADLSAVTLDTLSGYQFNVAGSLPTGVAITDFSLSLKSTTSLKIYFTATSLSGVVCEVDGVAVSPKATGVANEYCIEIENITAKDLDTNYEVSIGECTLTLNTLSYAYRALEYTTDVNLKTAMQALYLYNQAANEYFKVEA